jgi:putative capsule biosynthesis protein capA
MKATRALAAAALFVAASACAGGRGADPPRSPTTRTASPAPTTATGAPQAASSFTIVSGGDILLHMSVNQAARAGSGYDYTQLLAGIRPWIEGADLALCALEVPIVPPGEKPSNYPAFGSPPQIADSLKALGWDGCALATNHSMDRGFPGVVSTVDNFDRVGLGRHGTARTGEESTRIQYYKVRSGGRDVVVAHLSATTLTNGIPLPKGAEWSWNVVGSLGRRSVGDLVEDARRARRQGADIVVVSMHWGTEYVSQPTAEQTAVGDQLAKSGQIDLVFGNHSHVPEPVAKLAGGPGGRGMWVVWSMGNTISGQTVQNHGYRVMAGLMTTATVDVPAKGSARVSNLEWTAIAQDERTDRVFQLSRLTSGERPASMTLSPAEIASRAKATYPVMGADGSKERVTPPTPRAQLIGRELK